MSREPTKVIRRLVQAGADCSAKSYWRAATQRLEVATFLLKKSEYFLDAIYLAGYAVECSLKALILKRTPRSKQAAVCEEISSGAKAHNLDFLEEILSRRSGRPAPKEVSEVLNVIKCEWSPNLRYEGAMVPYKESAYFIKSVLQIYLWAERSK